MTNLKKIFIRAINKDRKWNSLSLDELIEMGSLGQIQLMNWLLLKCTGKDLMEIDKTKNSKEHFKKSVQEIVEFLESEGVTIVKLK